MKKNQHFQEFTNAGLALIAKRFRALGDCNRLRLMVELAQGEKTVGALTATTGLTQTNVSRHLQTLAAVGLLARRKEGLSVYYSVAEPSIFEFCSVMCRGLQKHLTSQAKAVS